MTARNLRKSYGEKCVVGGIDLDLTSGKIVGLLGPNGAGKSTTVGMLYGLIEADEGEVTIGGEILSERTPQTKKRIGVVTQDNNLDPDFTVEENLIHFAHHYRITGGAAQRLAAQLLEQVELDSYAKYRIDQLSGGLQRRLVLARALINSPQVIFLDEPTTGLDPEARQLFWRLILNLKQSERAILLTTHYMEEAERVCDTIYLMQGGTIVDWGQPADLVIRIAGSEVIELEGLNELAVASLSAKYETWFRSYSQGFLLGVPQHGSQELWSELAGTPYKSLTKRKSNLEDVFLLLTGKRLGS